MNENCSLKNKLIYVIAIIYSTIPDNTFPKRNTIVIKCESKGHELVELKFEMTNKTRNLSSWVL